MTSSQGADLRGLTLPSSTIPTILTGPLFFSASFMSTAATILPLPVIFRQRREEKMESLEDFRQWGRKGFGTPVTLNLRLTGKVAGELMEEDGATFTIMVR